MDTRKRIPEKDIFLDSSFPIFKYNWYFILIYIDIKDISDTVLYQEFLFFVSQGNLRGLAIK